MIARVRSTVAAILTKTVLRIVFWVLMITRPMRVIVSAITNQRFVVQYFHALSQVRIPIRVLNLNTGGVNATSNKTP